MPVNDTVSAKYYYGFFNEPVEYNGQDMPPYITEEGKDRTYISLKTKLRFRMIYKPDKDACCSISLKILGKEKEKYEKLKRDLRILFH